MPISISSDAVTEKNKLSSSDMWLLLLELAYENEDIGRICLNNNTITWDGEEWLPAVFNLSDLEETKDPEIPSVKLTFKDIKRTLFPILDEFGGAIGAIITVYVVHSEHLDNSTPELKEEFEVLSTVVDSNFTITFELGAENLSRRRCPQNVYYKNFCRFPFKSSACGYTGVELDCNRTFIRCKELNNETRYGGFPGVGSLGIQV